MKKVSVIIPFYNGNKHLKRLKHILDTNYKYLSNLTELEVILVNDSPWIKVDQSIITSEQYEVKIVDHVNNSGIHQARITGVKNSTGDYILFLDQDDVLSDDGISLLYKEIKKSNTECVIGNGVFETSGESKLILDSYGKVIAAKNRNSYLILGNLLCSPGQCLILKKAIPDYWLTHVVKSNCSDDLFLWCLMMKKKNVSYCNHLVYLHVNTGENLSLDKANGYKSDMEVFRYLQNSKEISRFWLHVFKMRYHYNMQKLNCRIDNKVQYALYYCMKNSYKIYLFLLAQIISITGRRTPQLANAKFSKGD